MSQALRVFLSIVQKVRSFVQAILADRKRVISLLVVCCLLFVGLKLASKYFTEPSAPPQDVKVTNITDQSLTVSWVTDKPCFGFVFYSPKKYPFIILSKIPLLPTFLALNTPFELFKIAPDDHAAFSTTHHATLKNLEPETPYFYRISTGYHIYKSQITNHKSQILPNIKAAKTLESVPFPDPIYGQVVLERDLATPVKNALVYLSIYGANPISSYTDEKGAYVLDLSNLRTGNLDQIFKADLNTEFNFSASAGKLGTGKLTIKRSLMNPTPRILIKQNP